MWGAVVAKYPWDGSEDPGMTDALCTATTPNYAHDDC